MSEDANSSDNGAGTNGMLHASFSVKSDLNDVRDLGVLQTTVRTPAANRSMIARKCKLQLIVKAGLSFVKMWVSL